MSPVTRRGALSLLPLAGAALAPACITVTASAAEGITPALAAILAKHEMLAGAYREEDARFMAFYDSVTPRDFRGRDEPPRAPGDTAKIVAWEHELDELRRLCVPLYEDILDFPCRTLTDVRAKLPVLISAPCGASDFYLSEEEVKALFASIMGPTA